MYHNPYLVNSYNQTVAMLLSTRNIDIPEKWEHNPIL